MEGNKSYRFGVLGSGSWATALVKILCENLDHVSWHVGKAENASFIHQHGRNPKYLQSVTFNRDKLCLFHEFDSFAKSTDILIVAMPAAFLYTTIGGFSPSLFEGKWVISAIKGIVPEHNAIPARFFHKTFHIPYEHLGIICGPCHAEEIALEKLSYLTVGSENSLLTKHLSDALRCEYVAVNESDDLFGAELGAILKNVYAIAAGMYAGLGYGDNFQAVLVCNSIQEMKRFINVIHPIHRDVNSIAYLGDLLVTCYSKFSRNRSFGYMLGEGLTLESAQQSLNMIAEGYYATKSLMEINRKFMVEMPILSAVYEVIYEGANCSQKMKELTRVLS
ncbi:MAG: NAD(P)H-dependent glycerol-3-phosphate dehydrogenase [Bacteroidetes bacterium]|nr:NAD(P)H-dependent glycerol-3-phosphate dehydrogenase [Bacteroidota bacterium]MBM3424189.1 NAD(P)H-dependent glycerol-3-phosphate dehydrogenase [Bacteroidota bacterium]